MPGYPDSPYYSYAGGLVLLLVVVFVLGVLATRAEPALNVLGRTVAKLSGGAFSARMLISAVCVGVGTGMVVGAVKVLFQGASLIPAARSFVIIHSIFILFIHPRPPPPPTPRPPPTAAQSTSFTSYVSCSFSPWSNRRKKGKCKMHPIMTEQSTSRPTD